MIVCPRCGAGHDDAGFACPACGYRPDRVDGIPLLAPALAGEVEGFDPAAFAMLAAAEDGHFWFESRNRLIVRTLRRWFPEARDYLEVGCPQADFDQAPYHSAVLNYQNSRAHVFHLVIVPL